ncbi:MAG: hypothetical protein WCR72_11180 [Bacteroidota bacterium]
MQRYFSTPPIFSAPVTNIDRELGIIQGVTIARVGIAKGHGGFVDRTFLLQIVDNAASKPAGIKARFGHPNMCSQALGTYLGRFKNYSYSGDQVKADLHLDETSKNTPNGDLFSYVLDMAGKNPDMFGASIVFEIGESVFLEEEVDGKKVEKEYFRLQELRATDIVDEPAATDGLFSANTFPGIATQFLDENPEIMDLIFSKPDSVVEFLSNYITNSKMNLSEKIKQNFAAFLAAFSAPSVGESDTEQRLLSEAETNTLNTLFDAVSASYPESFTSVEGLTSLQKAEALTAFFSSVSDKLQTSLETEMNQRTAFDALNTEHQALVSSNEATLAELSEANTRIQDLTAQLGARPSIPLNVTDPAVGLSSGSQEKDETGKQILAAMPKDIKRKLKNNG